MRIAVRGFGYSVIHLADVPDALMVNATMFGAPFEAVTLPVVALCGRQVRSVQDVAVRMPDGTKVRCRECARLPGAPRPD